MPPLRDARSRRSLKVVVVVVVVAPYTRLLYIRLIMTTTNRYLFSAAAWRVWVACKPVPVLAFLSAAFTCRLPTHTMTITAKFSASRLTAAPPPAPPDKGRSPVEGAPPPAALSNGSGIQTRTWAGRRQTRAGWRARGASTVGAAVRERGRRVTMSAGRGNQPQPPLGPLPPHLASTSRTARCCQVTVFSAKRRYCCLSP
ncbi:hypothetical protein E2C01_059484 [Portunus trituberculatus]|uniref:Uncharacterized protein n=1 Tax=Portunus trituberculatus TaxID=210409 RepID=A0A5B7GZA4_PORTR|nr:hypothetical protein [Portunus trituberculatus]